MWAHHTGLYTIVYKVQALQQARVSLQQALQRLPRRALQCGLCGLSQPGADVLSRIGELLMEAVLGIGDELSRWRSADGDCDGGDRLGGWRSVSIEVDDVHWWGSVSREGWCRAEATHRSDRPGCSPAGSGPGPPPGRGSGCGGIGGASSSSDGRMMGSSHPQRASRVREAAQPGGVTSQQARQ